MRTEFWADELAVKAEARHAAPFVVSDWKTPSGRVHVGALRGVLLHDAAARSLKHAGHLVRYVFGFDDFDPLDGVPSYLDQAAYAPYLGQPTFTAPAPDADGRPKASVTDDDNFARFFADEFEGVYRSLGVTSETLRSSELYRSGDLNGAIRLALDHAADVRAAYEAVIVEHRSADRRAKAVGSEYPLNVLCDACGKIATTVVTAWDGSVVTYDCRVGVVPYVDGCGHHGSVSPFDGHAKLPWKVEWAAKWFYLRTDVEGAGKDHYTKGGSHDVAQEIFRRVFAPALPADHAHTPEDLFYEWLYFGGKKMSTSRGVGASAKEVADQIPGELLRFLLVRTRPKTGVDFEPTNETIARLFDEYDRVLAAANVDQESHEAAIMRVAAVEERELPRFVMRFSKVTQLVQLPHVDISAVAEADKGSALTEVEQHELERRIDYAKQWVERDPERLEIQPTLPLVDLTTDQRQFLGALGEKIATKAAWTGDELHEVIHELKNTSDIQPKAAFQAIYRVFLNRDQGPQAGLFLAALDHDFVVERLREASTLNVKETNA